MDDLSYAPADGDAPPRSYAAEYLLLERSDADDPMWVLCRVVAACEAATDAAGQPTGESEVEALQWATTQLMRVINPQSLPGSKHVYRLEDGQE